MEQYCDFGHPSEEVRKLPLTEGANLLLCREHYASEIFFRRRRNRELGFQAFTIPRWDDLEIYENG